MALSPRQKKFLRAEAHGLSPVAFVGQNGLTDAVVKEIDRNLTCHELIKVRLRVEDKSELLAATAPVLERTGAELVQVIGRLMVLYRPAPEKKIALP